MNFMIFVGIILAIVVRMALGMFWYSPSVFGASWMKMVGISEKDLPKNPAPMIFGAIITSLIIVSMIACLIARLNITTVWSGILLGLSLWFGFVGTSNFGGVLWERRSFSWFILTTGYEFIAYGLCGGILGFFS